MIRETWATFLVKAIWEWDGRMWVKIGYRRYDEYVVRPYRRWRL